ncbi:MAG: hypothetical protein HY808_01025 [Nitrospirae bacterium]|nr:hypothetical protein [Nitrospirota bacterium]
MIRPVDCPKKNLNVNMMTGYTGGVIRRDLEVIVRLKVSCGGNPVPDADVRLEYWWSDSQFVHVTDSNGVLQVERNVMTDPRGNEVRAVVMGRNGKKVVKMKVEQNWDDIMSRTSSDKIK